MHHRSGSGEACWDEIQQSSVAIFLGGREFHVQLRLERQETSRELRVAMFGRRLVPKVKRSNNTQRATFKSGNFKEGIGYYLHPYFKSSKSWLRDAAKWETVSTLGETAWHDGLIALGLEPNDELLISFLRAVDTLETVKAMPRPLLKNCFSSNNTFTFAEVKAAETLREGIEQNCRANRRSRSSQLRRLAVEYFKARDPEGRLRCWVDGWVSPPCVARDIVEIHHEKWISDYPTKGRRLPFAEAIRFLYPLCPNCHRMLDSKQNGQRYKVSELRDVLSRDKKS